jgi:hypothetical protein
MGRVWWTAVRTGRWLHGGGRAHYFPSKYYAFSLYDRASSPVMYRFGVIVFPMLFFGVLFLSVAATMRFVHHMPATYDHWNKPSISRL